MLHFFKYADCNKMKYAAKICGIGQRKRRKEYLKLSKNIQAVESDGLCGKICDVHTFRKCVKYLS